MGNLNSDPQEITSQNEEYVRQWFELSEFASVRLDSSDGKTGKNADWKFSKQDLNIICEVKTIFSGGQSGLTEEQWKRNKLEEKKKLDQYISSLSKSEKSVDYLDWINGQTPYRHQIIRKEGVEGAKGTYKDFKQVLKNDLQNDEDIGSLPFDLSITISGLYVPSLTQYKDFFDWLKGFVIWANQNRNLGPFYPSYSYKFEPDARTTTGQFIYGAEAFAQLWGANSLSKP